ncbi:MAG TPA: PrsW family glutamic-type intramembrane protease [Chloroflexota bacterium]|nr:PrsW family glutamic-type intramembrane protease [Chloroflexota bacterium]
MTCIYCEKDTPDGRFCTWCGRQQIEGESRSLHYAPHPGEHLWHPAVFTTLFPHLGRHKLHEFRWALIAGLSAIVLLTMAGLITAALLCAALLVPVLYLLYLYEAQVYRDEPVLVVGLTLGGGALLGVVVTLVVNQLTQPVTLPLLFGDSLVALLVLGVAVPIVQEIVKVVPALLLRGRPAFQERVDGLAFGVAAGLGFSLAETLVRYWSVLSNFPTQTDPANWMAPLLTIAVLLPLLQGSATGAIAATLWRRGSARDARAWAVIGLAVGAHCGFVLVSQLLADHRQSQLVILAWQAAFVGVLLLTVRATLHRSLLEEATHMGLVETTCSNCHNAIVAAAFCPVCGKALSASAATTARTRRGEPVQRVIDAAPATEVH